MLIQKNHNTVNFWIQLIKYTKHAYDDNKYEMFVNNYHFLVYDRNTFTILDAAIKTSLWSIWLRWHKWKDGKRSARLLGDSSLIHAATTNTVQHICQFTLQRLVTNLDFVEASLGRGYNASPLARSLYFNKTYDWCYLLMSIQVNIVQCCRLFL